ncbi:hypothetical protein chiPu_0028956 [Chiloscyllium punctatum]|uniref:Uncharacterized protein n=1 Tax=Chiloscyllium punctatum TaxID=137246 RepID=A0A401TQP0_CHIPU|nr:hypothetical protein [Chiloscyllium punctatum]
MGLRPSGAGDGPESRLVQETSLRPGWCRRRARKQAGVGLRQGKYGGWVSDQAGPGDGPETNWCRTRVSDQAGVGEGSEIRLVREMGRRPAWCRRRA